MNLRVGVQPKNHFEQLRRRRRLGQSMIEMLDSRFVRLPGFARHVNLARGIFAHQHYRQTGSDAARAQLRDPRRDALTQTCRDHAAIDNSSAHESLGLEGRVLWRLMLGEKSSGPDPEVHMDDQARRLGSKPIRGRWVSSTPGFSVIPRLLDDPICDSNCDAINILHAGSLGDPPDGSVRCIAVWRQAVSDTRGYLFIRKAPWS